MSFSYDLSMKKLGFLVMVFALSGCGPLFNHGAMRSLEQTPDHTRGMFSQGYGSLTTEADRQERENEKIREYEAKYCGGKKLQVTSKKFDFKENGYHYNFECK